MKNQRHISSMYEMADHHPMQSQSNLNMSNCDSLNMLEEAAGGNNGKGNNHHYASVQ